MYTFNQYNVKFMALKREKSLDTSNSTPNMYVLSIVLTLFKHHMFLQHPVPNLSSTN